MRLAVLISHPIQYYAPIFRALAARCDLQVFFGQQLNPNQQKSAGFGTAFEWDVDLTSGYPFTFLRNVARNPGPDRFLGCDTPEIAGRLREENFDALVVAGWYLKCHAQAILAARRIGLPVLVRGDSHLETPQPAARKIAKWVLYPPLLRLFDGALYVGTKSRAYYTRYGYPAERLFHSPHCVATDWFSVRATQQARSDLRTSLGIAGSTTLALFAGKMMPCKRPIDIVTAAARCRAAGADLQILVAGSGELEAQIKRRAGALAVPIHMLGFCNQSRMPAAYAASDVLVLPSAHETWGLVANEALACNRPVIVSDACGCAPDLAADGKAGRVYRPGDTEALASALMQLIAAPPRRDLIQAVSQRHSVAAAVQGVIEGSASLISRRAASQRRKVGWVR